MNGRTLVCAAAFAVSLLLPIAAHAQEDPCAGGVEYANEVVNATAPFVEANGTIDFGGERDVTTITTAEWKQLGDTAAASMFALAPRYFSNPSPGSIVKRT